MYVDIAAGLFAPDLADIVVSLLIVYPNQQGISMSLESIEITRRTTSNGVLSLIKPRRFNTLVVGFILMGQLVGSSGGIMFLAEFVVTSVCLLIGGITITARALESWITFFCLSSTAFWGYVFARLGVLDGIKKKRCGLPSLLLCLSLWLALGMWLLVFMTAMHQPETQLQSPGTFILGQIIAVARAVSPKKNIG